MPACATGMTYLSPCNNHCGLWALGTNSTGAKQVKFGVALAGRLDFTRHK